MEKHTHGLYSRIESLIKLITQQQESWHRLCQIANTLALEDTLNRMVLSALFILFISGTLPIYIPQTDMEPHAGSPEFEQMKSLVGTWRRPDAHG